MPEIQRELDNDWQLDSGVSTELDHYQVKKREEREDKRLDYEFKERDEAAKERAKDAEFKRELIKEGLGLIAATTILVFSVYLSMNDYKDEAAMVAAIAGGIGGGFGVLTGSTLNRKRDELI